MRNGEMRWRDLEVRDGGVGVKDGEVGQWDVQHTRQTNCDVMYSMLTPHPRFHCQLKQ